MRTRFQLLQFLCFLCSLQHVAVVINGEFIVEPGPKVKATTGAVWPKPQQKKSAVTFMVLQQNKFKFSAINNDCDILQDAFKRYKKIIFDTDPRQTHPPNFPDDDWTKWEGVKNFKGFLKTVDVDVKENCSRAMPSFNMNESYKLNINSPKEGYAILSANTVWGALRGLETLSQLLYAPEENRIGLIVNTTEIVDFPRFSHRGLLIDTSRHYLPLGTILKNLDAMSYNKLNVLHWHIVDDQSFPFKSDVYPDLIKGAYSNKLIYTKYDIKKVVRRAASRGIRVVPEFDTPGHTRSWGVAYLNLLTPCYEDGEATGGYGPLDPTKEETYKFVRNLLDEVKNTFPDDYMHLGGDEVELDCWDSNPDIQNFMKNKNITNTKKLEEYYIQRAINITNDLNIKSVVWEEVFTDGANISKDTIVHAWKPGLTVMAEATEAGYPTLISSCWYLDHLKTGGDWQKYYLCDPYDFNPNEEQKKLVLGGEACMWGESVNVYNVLSRIWPRASAVAEKLWSKENADTMKGAARRLEEHTCRMNIRRIPAQPPNGPGVCVPALEYKLYN